tara:strand:+ start:887 stop:1564 length:678 start_codon:yes stop_codon:yes gene_type:complete
LGNLGKRLTEKQKEEISKLFTSGVKVEELSTQYKFTKFTIIRNLKKKLGGDQYSLLVSKSNKLNNKKNKKKDNKIEKQNQKKMPNDITEQDNKKDSQAEDLSQISEFVEIAPLNFDIDNSPQKDLTSVSISEVKLPKIVYMIVDKKVELEIKYLKDYPKWQFLSQDELNRKTIEIYYDLKIAKSFCEKEQKVIKVPNTNVFKIVAPILSSRGISRIITAENLIAL